jgi:hypothetical protein
MQAIVLLVMSFLVLLSLGTAYFGAQMGHEGLFELGKDALKITLPAILGSLASTWALTRAAATSGTTAARGTTATRRKTADPPVVPDPPA